MTEAKPQIDYTRIEFPSDLVSLKQLRSLQLMLGDVGEDLDLMHMQEREFARLGFSRQWGDEEEIRGAIADIIDWSEADGACNAAREVQDAREHLASLYVQFGIAEGPETAKQLIQRLELMGAEQAQRQRGGRRP
jgi:hypothetical protein